MICNTKQIGEIDNIYTRPHINPDIVNCKCKSYGRSISKPYSLRSLMNAFILNCTIYKRNAG